METSFARGWITVLSLIVMGWWPVKEAPSEMMVLGEMVVGGLGGRDGLLEEGFVDDIFGRIMEDEGKGGRI